MHPLYEDILELAGGKEPLWWDDNGVPRFWEFHPKLVPSIYADEALLMIIECQACGRKFPVCAWWDIGRYMYRHAKENTDKTGKEIRILIDQSRLSYQIKNGHIPYYGDAPWHTIDGRQCAGTTMTTDTLTIKEFWAKEDFEWVRVPECEISFL